MNDSDLIAAFLARKGATQCETAPAYGVDKEADKARRVEARAARRHGFTESEAAHDRRMSAAHDAFFVGDRDGGFAMLGERWSDAPEAVTRANDGRRVRLNRY